MPRHEYNSTRLKESSNLNSKRIKKQFGKINIIFVGIHL